MVSWFPLPKSRKRLIRFLVPLVIGFVLIGVLVATLRAAPSQAGPVQVVNLNTASIITTTTFAGGRWSALGTDTPPITAEVWLFVDETTVNTTTFVLQVSPDGTTYVNHSTVSALASDVAADSNTYKVATIEGVFYQIVATLTNTNTLTPTIKVVLR